jgi:broad specificity phosphatase PhoE
MTVSSNTESNANSTSTDPPVKQQKRLICIRHARSQGNEFLAKPGNRWGDPTFCDDPNLIDAKLTDTGMQQVHHELLPTWQDNPIYQQLLMQVDLVVVSPLTRTQQTFQYGVLPALQQLQRMPRILAHPLATERVYTASDTGRSVPELAREFPWVDWSIVAQAKQKWWYTHNINDTSSYQEWRPHGQGQWYAVPGEPHQEFTTRMKQLEDWIDAQQEHTILLVAHWGVIQYLTGGYSAENCEIKLLVPWEPLHRQSGPVATTTTAAMTKISKVIE